MKEIFDYAILGKRVVKEYEVNEFGFFNIMAIIALLIPIILTLLKIILF